MENSLVLYQVNNRIAEITINRPEKRNALNPALVESLKSKYPIQINSQVKEEAFLALNQ